MNLASSLGFAASALIVLALAAWIITRHFVGKSRRTPLSIVLRGWRLVRQLTQGAPRLMAFGAAAWLLQAWAKDIHTLLFPRMTPISVASDVAIDFLFALGWAAFAVCLHVTALAPEISGPEIRAITRRAVSYAAAFWIVLFALNMAGFLMVMLFKGRDQRAVLTILHYLTYGVIALAALTRPGIAIASTQPVRDAAAVAFGRPFATAATLILAILPLGLVMFAEDAFAATVTMPIAFFFVLEAPFAILSMLTYGAFEAAVAFLFKRTAFWVLDEASA